MARLCNYDPSERAHVNRLRCPRGCGATVRLQTANNGTAARRSIGASLGGEHGRTSTGRSVPMLRDASGAPLQRPRRRRGVLLEGKRASTAPLFRGGATLRTEAGQSQALLEPLAGMKLCALPSTAVSITMSPRPYSA